MERPKNMIEFFMLDISFGLFDLNISIVLVNSQNEKLSVSCKEFLKIYFNRSSLRSI